MGKPDLAQLVVVARDLLTLRDGAVTDLWLWEHTQRVVSLARMLSLLPDFGDEPPDDAVVCVSALFHDVGWADQVRQGVVPRALVLSRPTSDVQRELSIEALRERGSGLAPAAVIDAAVTAIRECNRRAPSTPEARVLAEAESVDEIGLMYVLRQLRQGHADGRSIAKILEGWRRQLEYKFWEARINEGLRFDATRRLARQRLTEMELLMGMLARESDAADLRVMLKQMGLTPPVDIDDAGSPPSKR